MTSSYSIKSDVQTVLSTVLDIEDARVVPKTEDVALSSGAKKIEATYAYADLADSTTLAQIGTTWTVARVIRSYVNTAAALFRNYGGEIRSFDGDRVMAIFVGPLKNDNAVRAALAINWAVIEVINPMMQRLMKDLADRWTMRHGIGIDTGEGLIVRGGVRGHNDLISIGRAPNVAAKLSEVRGEKTINITTDVYQELHGNHWETDGVNMWTNTGQANFGGNKVTVMGSSYYWEP